MIPLLLLTQLMAAPCGLYAPMVAKLSLVYREELVFLGTDPGGAGRIEIYASAGGTWTALSVTGPTACIQAIGTEYKLTLPGTPS